VKYSYFFLVINLLFIINFAGCNNNIEGIVQDIDGTPLEDVTVKIEKTNFLSITDIAGHYSIDYNPGKIVLCFTKDGYIKNILSLDILEKTLFPAENIILYKYDNTSPEKLAKSIIHTLNSNDKYAFESFAFPEKDTLLNFYKKMLPIDRQEEAINKLPMTINKIKKTVFSSWNEIYSKGIMDGVVWESAEYKQTDFKLENINKTQSAELFFIVISCNNIDYVLRISSSLRINSKWYLLVGMQWEGRLGA